MTSAGLEYVVLRCADLERSRIFYQALCLQLVQEQHGPGHPHYSAELGATVLELYPLSDKPSAGVRLGIRVSALGAVLEAMKRIGAEVPPRQIENARDHLQFGFNLRARRE